MNKSKRDFSREYWGKKHIIIPTNCKDFHDYLILLDMVREAPQHEKNMCDKIERFIWEKASNGLYIKDATLIGTPTCWAVSPQFMNNGRINDDNLMVANALSKNSDIFNMVIGSGENKDKAKAKGQTFYTLSSMRKARIWTGTVCEYSFYRWIEKKCEKYKNENIVIVLMTSGSWTGGKNNRKYSTNFKKPSIELIGRYPNLHIIAGVMNWPGFKVLYLHNEKIDTI